VGFEPAIPVFEREKTFHASERAATVIGKIIRDQIFIYWNVKYWLVLYNKAKISFNKFRNMIIINPSNTDIYWRSLQRVVRAQRCSVTLQCYTREVLNSDLFWDTRYPDWRFPWVYSAILRKWRNSTAIKPRHFLPNPFQFIIRQSFFHSTLCNLDTDSIVK
jgi:hypothetical protein